MLEEGDNLRLMEASTLKCPMCGAATRDNASHCAHCGVRLATIACPKCFGRVFLGAQFCSHCGAAAARTPGESAEPRSCPHCRVTLASVALGTTQLHECPRCEGIWMDAAALERLSADREQQAAVLGAVTPLPPKPADLRVRYVPCPVCRQLMNRVNFAGCSQVIVDVCRPHGTWFDREELQRMVDFIRAGGLQKARAREVAQLEDKKRRLQQEVAFDRTPARFREPYNHTAGWCAGLSLAECVVDLLFDP
jgi:Zn-finger nucleic acid-binding protein